MKLEKSAKRLPFEWDKHGWEQLFVANLVRVRDECGWTQYQLSQRALQRGLLIHQTTLQRIETGERPVKLSEAIVLADLLGQTLDDMIKEPTMKATESALVWWLDRMTAPFHEVRDSAGSVAKWILGVEDATRAYQRSAERGQVKPDALLVGTANELVQIYLVQTRGLRAVGDDVEPRLRKAAGELDRRYGSKLSDAFGDDS